MTAIAQAILVAKTRIGWDGASADIPYALRDRYRTALAEEIIAHAPDFPPAHVELARRELAHAPDQPLESYGLIERAADFGGEFAHQAGKVGASVAAVGEGVKSTLGLTRWLLPLAGLAVVVILLGNLKKAEG